MTRILEVDPQDESILRAYFETEQAAMRADRPDAMLRTWESVRFSAQQPGPYYRRTLLVALADGGRVVGTADLGRSIGDNERVADLEVTVLSEQPAPGIGRAAARRGGTPRARGRADHGLRRGARRRRGRGR